MKQPNKTLLRALYTILLVLLLAVPALAADTEELLDIPEETTETVEPTVQAEIPTLTSGDSVLALIEKYEGFSAEPYKDSNVMSIGYGTRLTKAQAKYGEDITSITKEQALELVREDLATVESALNRFLKKKNILLNQNQFDALVDFTYNVGTGWIYNYQNADETHCLLMQLLLDDPSTWTETRTQEAFGAWVTADGKVLPGLVRRRSEEAQLFLTPVGEQETEMPYFTDVTADAWYYPWVQEAAESGLVNGYGDGTFGPNDSLTRAQLVKVLAVLAGVDTTLYSGVTAFSDVKAEDWYAPYLAWAVEEGIVSGYEDGTFRPNEPILRQHTCSILARYLRSQNISPTETAETFADDGLLQKTSRDDVYYCAALGMVQGVGNNLFDPNNVTTRGAMAKLMVSVQRLLA